MLGSSSQNSIFDSPSFLQKMMKKKSNKYNIRPLYTSDIVTEVNPWKKGLNAATTKITTSYNQQRKPTTKTYNHPSIHHQYIPSRPVPPPTLSPSISSTTAVSSSISENLFPIPSCSTPVNNNQSKRKRPLSSEILIRIMDQRIMRMQQQQQQQLKDNVGVPQLRRSVSASTTTSINNTTTVPRLNKITTRRNSATRHHHKQQQVTINKKLKTSKSSVLNKLNHTQQQQQLITDWPYVLTQDNDEQDRMVAQHYLLRTAFGKDFSSPIQPQLQKGIVVLDVGCGNGTWTMEMSTAFPKSTFIGIDQSAFYPKDIKPRNCHFRSCGSLVQHQLSLPFPDNSIDYIFQRDMNWGLSGQTWQPLLHEFQRILKPGGWIEFVEPDLETQNSLEHECAMNDKLMNGLCMRQQDPYLVHRLPTMLSINGFRRVEDCSQSFPLGWGLSHSTHSTTTASSILEEEEEVECDKSSQCSSHSNSSSTISSSGEPKETQAPPRPHCSEFARAMSSQYLFLLKSLRPWLSTVMNLNYEKYDEYISGLPAEWSRAQTFINWHCITAQKPLHS